MNYSISQWDPNQELSILKKLESSEPDQYIPGLNAFQIQTLQKNTDLVAYIEYQLVLDELHIHRVFVIKEQRALGLGKYFMTNFIAAFQGIKKIHLEVSEKNEAALRLYRQMGFQEMGLRKKYYKDGSDAITMLLER